MAYKHLFIDSDVLLDMLLNREPFSTYTQILLADHWKPNFKLSTSALVVANINYILSVKTSSTVAKNGIKKLIELINVLPFESDIIKLALNSAFTDFEDAIQYYIADRYKCDIIITRNIKDYKESAIPVLTAEQFLNTV